MKRYYKKQDSIEGVIYTGKENPVELFPDMNLTYQSKSKTWFYDETNELRPGFYYKDDWGKWKWMHPDFFAMHYNTAPYAIITLAD